MGQATITCFPVVIALVIAIKASLVAQCLGWEDPLKKETATHSSMLAWEIPWTQEPGKLQSTELQESRI